VVDMLQSGVVGCVHDTAMAPCARLRGQAGVQRIGSGRPRPRCSHWSPLWRKDPGPGLAIADPVGVIPEKTHAVASRWVAPGGGEFCGDEKRTPGVGARSALPQLTRRDCLNEASAASGVSFATRPQAEHRSGVGAQRRPAQHEPRPGATCRDAPPEMNVPARRWPSSDTPVPACSGDGSASGRRSCRPEQGARPPKIGFVSLGCPKALTDSELILTQLRAEGYETSKTFAGADLVIVNTCGFIDDAVKESLDTIGEALASQRQGHRHRLPGRQGGRGRRQPGAQVHPKVLAVTGPHATQEVMDAVHRHVPKPHDPFVDLVPAASSAAWPASSSRRATTPT
jgi:hypothetical protein